MSELKVRYWIGSISSGAMKSLESKWLSMWARRVKVAEDADHCVLAFSVPIDKEIEAIRAIEELLQEKYGA